MVSYLNNLGFENDIVRVFSESIPKNAIKELEDNKEIVVNNINYLKGLNVSNYVDIFVKFYNMFLLDNRIFESIFSKYDTEDLVVKLEKNPIIMEYL